VLQAALSRFHETAAAVVPQSAAEVPPFIEAATFQGVKPGYYFATGSSGVGSVPALLHCPHSAILALP